VSVSPGLAEAPLPGYMAAGGPSEGMFVSRGCRGGGDTTTQAPGQRTARHLRLCLTNVVASLGKGFGERSYHCGGCTTNFSRLIQVRPEYILFDGKRTMREFVM